MLKNSTDFTVSMNSAFAGTLAFADCIIEDDGDKRTVVNPESRWSLVAEMESEREGANEGTKFTATFRKRRVGAKLGSRVTRKK